MYIYYVCIYIYIYIYVYTHSIYAQVYMNFPSTADHCPEQEGTFVVYEGNLGK